jgi:hypothetical protein
MTTATAPTTVLRGDICPSWCGGIHQPDRLDSRGRPAHPEDAGVAHTSAVVAAWTPTEQGADEIEVRVEGFRHDHNPDGWPDRVRAENTHPGFMSAVDLQVADARRLGEALLKACDLAEARA